MTEFEKYVERRESCEAIKFMDIAQASEVAQFFNPLAYTVEAFPDLRLVITGQDRYTGEERHIEINRGDFVVKNRNLVAGGTVRYGDFQVVPRLEFQRKFMVAE